MAISEAKRARNQALTKIREDVDAMPICQLKSELIKHGLWSDRDSRDPASQVDAALDLIETAWHQRRWGVSIGYGLNNIGVRVGLGGFSWHTEIIDVGMTADGSDYRAVLPLAASRAVLAAAITREWLVAAV